MLNYGMYIYAHTHIHEHTPSLKHINTLLRTNRKIHYFINQNLPFLHSPAKKSEIKKPESQ